MQTYELRSWLTSEILYSGLYPSIKSCIESALQSNIDLSYADLSGLNLVNIDLDEAILYNVRFENTNLQGANISDAQINQCNFKNSSLQIACLAYTSITNCEFSGAHMHGCDLSGARLSSSIFSTRSACSLNFIDTESITKCLYKHQDETLCSFSRPPIHINGLEQPLTIFDDCLLVGNTRLQATDLDYANDNLSPNRNLPSTVHTFISKHQAIFQTLYRTRISNEKQAVT